jgi:hypothetical protein
VGFLLTGRGAQGGLADGGVEELPEFRFNCRRNSATSSRNCCTSRSKRKQLAQPGTEVVGDWFMPLLSDDEQPKP